MKREITDVLHPGYCCPGHDKYPSDTYRSRRSKKQRRVYKCKEHRHARRVKKQSLKQLVEEL